MREVVPAVVVVLAAAAATQTPEPNLEAMEQGIHGCCRLLSLLL